MVKSVGLAPRWVQPFETMKLKCCIVANLAVTACPSASVDNEPVKMLYKLRFWGVLCCENWFKCSWTAETGQNVVPKRWIHEVSALVFNPATLTSWWAAIPCNSQNLFHIFRCFLIASLLGVFVMVWYKCSMLTHSVWVILWCDFKSIGLQVSVLAAFLRYCHSGQKFVYISPVSGC